jgi:hypothetical protein
VPTPPGDALTRQTVRLALALWALALLLSLTLDDAGRSARTPAGRLARLTWSLGWLVYVVHVGLAFHFFHGWSHAAAVRHVEERSGFGPGIAFSHLFTLAWGLDAAWWWLRPDSHAGRPAWVGRALVGYMAFVVFNATVVFEAGTVRLAGLLVTALLGSAWLLRLLAAHPPGEPS